ncbi:acyltransferase family protein [Herbiconiux sp. UC225_62]|uniref:acyltransferase family protein n=1 Tax=Herbiconiux sp. UC225_62 TaxID=3350168 RepID=UPI0036D2B2F4
MGEAVAIETRRVSRSETFRSDIQGLRAIAVGVVVLYHAGVPGLQGGYLGVDVFFVISGFLITSHLLREITVRGTVRFREFYARRARRILPASFAVLIVTTVLVFFLIPPLQRPANFEDAIATAFYVPNMLFAVQGTDYLAEATPSVFQHYWSLGVEEQFYLFWPAILVVLGLAGGALRSKKAIAVGVIAITAVSFALCAWLTYRSQPWAFFSLPTRAWEFGVGGAIAVLPMAKLRERISANASAALAWVGLGGLIACVLLFTESTPFPGYWAALPVIATALIIGFGASIQPAGPTRVLSLRPMVFIGTISYSLYLIHWPALVLPQAAIGYFDPMPLWATISIALACVPVAWVMFKFIEEPARKWKPLVEGRTRRTFTLTVTASVVAAALALGGLTYTKNAQLSTDEMAAPIPVAVAPSGTTFVPLNLEPSLWDAAKDKPEIYTNGCHLDFNETDAEGCRFGPESDTVVALFGDSHAAQWFPGLKAWAESSGVTLETHTKSSCPSVEIDVTLNGVPFTQCDKWRQDVIDYIADTKPDLVLLANYYHSADSDPQQWEQGLRDTITELGTVDAAILADSPFMGQNPSICLSAHLTDTTACDRTPEFALTSPIRDAEARVAAATETPLIDLNDYFCSAEACPPIISNIAVYRDPHHVSSVFSEYLSDPLGERLESVLATRR